MISNCWFNQTAVVERYAPSFASSTETPNFDPLYAALPLAFVGRASVTAESIIGDLSTDVIKITVRQSDITSGWPQEGDRFTIAGKEYEVQAVEDHTLFAPFFTIPRHKVFELREIPGTPQA